MGLGGVVIGLFGLVIGGLGVMYAAICANIDSRLGILRGLWGTSIDFLISSVAIS